MAELERPQRLQIMLTEEELAAVENWRFEKRMPSRPPQCANFCAGARGGGFPDRRDRHEVAGVRCAGCRMG